MCIRDRYILAQAIAFLLSALYVKFRDVNYIWELILQAGFYATPILYPMTFASTPVPEQFQRLLLLNPVAQILQDARYVFVTKTTMTTWNHVGLWWSLLPLLIIIGLVIVAVLYFKKQSSGFAENI